MFDRTNWFIPQTITVTAEADLLAEGRQTILIQHSMVQGGSPDDGGAYDRLAVPSVPVDVIDDDVAEVVVIQTGNENLVSEAWAAGASNPSDTYAVLLTKAPTGPVTIELTDDGQIETLDGALNALPTLTFNTGNWNTPQTVTVRAVQDTAKEGFHYSRISHRITSSLNDFIGVTADDVRNGLGAAVNRDLTSPVTAEVSGLEVIFSGPAFTFTAGANATIASSTRAFTDVTLALSGPVASGNIWAIRLNGVPYTYIADSDDTLLNVAQGLANDINYDAVYAVTLNGTDLQIVPVEENVSFSATLLETAGMVTRVGSVTGTPSTTHYVELHATFTIGSTIARGDTWGFTLNGTDYRYVAGSNRENYNPGFIDFRIADDDVPGVLVTQSGGSTNVIEPSDWVVLGNGLVTQVLSTTDQNTRFEGDFGTSVLNELPLHDSIYNAQNIDLGKWNKIASTEIVSATTLPHLTILGKGNADTDFYRFDITDAMLDEAPGRSVTAIFDIDHGYEIGDAILWASRLRLYDGDGRLINQGPGFSNPIAAEGAGGSSTWLDDFLSVEFTAEGTYYIEVSNWLSFGGIPEGVDYQLNVSMEGHPTDGFIFSTEPIAEDEIGNNTGQNIEPDAPGEESNFYTFYDALVGNTHLGGSIDFQTPYARIQGSGDGTFDIYQFEITDDMLNPPALRSLTGTRDTSNYFTSISVALNGAVTPGDVWTLNLRYRNYAYTVQPGQTTLAQVAQGLANLLPSRFTVTPGNGTLAISDPNGFTIGGVSQLVQKAGDVTRKIAPQRTDSSPVEFTSIDVALAGTPTVKDLWYVALDDIEYSFEAATTSLTDVAIGLAAQIPNTYTVLRTGTTISVSRATAFHAEFGVTGREPTGTATISGTPVQADLPIINFTQAIFALSGAVTEGDDWVITVNGNARTETVDNNDDITDIAEKLKDNVDGLAGYTASRSGNTITVNRNTPFTAALEVRPASAVIATSTATTALLTVTGSTVATDNWAVRLAGTDYTFTSAGTSLSDVATGLANELNGVTGYTAVAEGTVIALTRLAGGTITVSDPVKLVSGGSADTTTSDATLVVLSGASGGTWNVAVTGATGSPFTATGASLSAVATTLSASINALADYAASFEVTGSTVTMTITRISGAVPVVTAGTTGSGSATVNTATPTSATATLSGTVANGDIWTVTVNGTEYSQAAALNDTPAILATALASQINGVADFTARVEGDSIVIANLAGTALTVSAPVRRIDAGSTSTSTAHTETLTLVDVPVEGDIWTIRLGTTNYPHTISSTDDLTDVVDALVTLVNADPNLTAVAKGGTIAITSLVGTNFALVFAVTPVALPVAGRPDVGWVQVVDFATTPAIAAGDTWTLKVNGSTHLAIADSTPLLTEIINDLQGAVTGFTAVRVGNTLEITDSTGAVVSVGPLTRTRSASTTSSPVTDNARDHFFDAEIELEGTFVAGDVWTITIDGREYNYPAPSGLQAGNNIGQRNLRTIANGLVTAINADTTAPFEATLLTGARFEITDKVSGAGNQDPFTVEFNRGGGEVHGVFDIDRSNLVSGVSRVLLLRIFGIEIFDQYPYLISPVIELLDENGTVLASDHYGLGGNVIDPGSTTDRDPFLEYDFTAEGIYQIRVRSYVDYLIDNPFFQDGFVNGVSSGQAYVLNMSVQNHDVNPNAIALADSRKPKTLTIVSGAGLGQSAIITGYDPETKIYTLDRELNPAPDATSRFEISYQLETEFPGVYAPVTDQYEIVLTGRPQGEVIIDVTPQMTRTYNSDDAFNPATNFGENEAVQVRVATPRARVVLDGSVVTNETWKLTLTSADLATVRNANVPATNGTSLTALVTAFLTAVNSTGLYTAVIDPTNPEAFIITSLSGGAFFLDSVITPETRGGFSVTGIAGVGGWRQVDVELTGEIAQGEVWTLALGGQSFTYTAGFRATLADAVASFKASIAASGIANDFDVLARGRVLSINRRDGTDFAIGHGITPDSQGSIALTPQLVFDTNNWSTPQTVTVMAIDDAVVDGSDALVFPVPEERVNTVRGPITVDGGVRVQEERFLNNPFTFPGETNYPLADGTIGDMAVVDEQITITDPYALHTGPTFGLRPGFDPRINDATYALTILNGPAIDVENDIESVSENILTVSNATAFNAGFTYSGLGSAERMTFRGIPNPAQLTSIDWRDVTVRLRGTVKANETWTITLDGTDYSATAADTSMLALVQALDTAIPNDYQLTLSTSVLGSRLFVRRADEAAFSFNFALSGSSEIETTIRGTPDQTAIGSIQWREASFFLSGSLLAGDVWTLNVGGNTASYTVLDSATPVGTMMEDLVEDIPNSFQPGISGDTITLLLPWPEDEDTGYPLEPGLGDAYFYAPINLNVRVNEVTQVDTLNVFNGQSPANDEGVLTEDRLTGLGMGGDTLIAGETIRGGIGYLNLEAVRIELGTGDDLLTIASTHQGATTVTTGLGADGVIIKSIGGHTSIETGDGDDAVLIGNDDLLVDQITGLLTIDTGAGDDMLTVNDSGDTNANTGTLTRTTLNGLDMPTVAEVQRIAVQAASGTYRLRVDGYGTESGLPNTSAVLRFAGFAEVTLDYVWTSAEVRTALRALYGTDDIEVTEVRTLETVTYDVMFVRELAGLDMLPLVWADTRGTTRLIPAEEASVNVVASTVRDGTTVPTLDTVEKLIVTATAGTFRIGLRLNPGDLAAVTYTAAIDFDATADEVLAALSVLLNPNNSNPAKPFTDNVAVSRHGSVYHIRLQGEHRHLHIQEGDLDLTQLTGTATLVQQMDGIAYYGVEDLEIDLGFESDVFHVASTGARTVIYAADGEDSINVRTIDHATVIYGGDDNDRVNVGSQFGLSNLPGTLNGISALLTIDGGAQTTQDVLTLDDTADSIDNVGRLSMTRVLGLGMAEGISYVRFDRFHLNLGSGADALRIYSTHGNETDPAERALNKQTFVTSGAGNDTINVGNNGLNLTDIPLADLAPGVDNVGDLLDIEGMGGRDTLNVDERIDGSNNVGRQLAGAVTDSLRAGRTSDAIIDGLDLTGRIGHFTFEIVNFLLGTGDDEFTIEVGEAAKEETNIYGGPGNDHIRFFDGQFITGELDGEAGLDDTVDYALWTGSITVNMPIGRATGIFRGFDGGLSNVENALGGHSKDFLIGDGADNELDGNEQDDFIQGGFGNDTLEGGSGNDFMEGGTGDDWYVLVPGSDDRVVDVAGHDTFDFSNALSAITVDLRLDSGEFQTVDVALNRLSIRGVIEDLVGSDFDDVVQGNSAENEIWGGDGADQIRGGSGADTIHGGNGADVLNGESGNDELFGDAEADTLLGSDNDDVLHGGLGNDSLYGNSGDDRLSGDEGDDLLDGDAGHDLLFFDTALAGVTVDLVARTATDGLGGTNSLVSIEGAIGTPFGDQLSGDNLANEFRGGAGNDVINGAGGGDLIVGGPGADTLSGGDSSDVFEWAEGDESDTIDAGPGASDLLRVVLGDTADTVNIATVTAAASRLERISGTTFALSFLNVRYIELATGGGNDVVMVSGEVLPMLARITIDAGAGDDRIEGALGGGGAGSFSTVALVVSGGEGNDRFYSGSRSDRFDGGDGFDTVDYSRAPTGVTGKLPEFREVTDREGVTTIVPVEGRVTNDGYRSRDTLVWVEEMVGSEFADRLTGSSLNDVIRGGGGADRIKGGLGNDQIFGDAGIDNLNGDAGDDIVDGGADNDVIRGGIGNDVLLGGLGDDSLRGDAGVDRYQHEAGSDIFTADAFDVVDYSNAPVGITVDMAANSKYGTAADGTGDIDRLVKVSYLVGSPFNDTLFGSKVANTFVGGQGDDMIDGRLGDDRIIWNDGDGTDTLIGGGGLRDTLEIFGSALADVITIDALNATTLRVSRTNGVAFVVTGTGFENLKLNTLGGDDMVTVSAFAAPVVTLLTVDLGAGNDTFNGAVAVMPMTVTGGEGDDSIAGGANRDSLFGGAGRDTVDYSAAAGAIKARLNGTVSRTGVRSDVDKLLEFERFVGTEFADTISATRNAEVIALGGNDKVTVSGGTNIIDGGDGNDVLRGGSGDDLLIGGAGNDTLQGMRGSDRLRGGEGNDRLDGGSDRNVDFADYSDATVGVEVNMATLQGRDNDDGSVGIDTFIRINGVIGSDFADVISGDALPNELRGGASNDRLEGGAGDDILIGDAGDDDILGGDGNDVVVWDLGDGDDTVQGGAGTNVGRLNGSLIAADAVELTANVASTVVDWNAGAGSPSFTGFARLEFFLGGGDDTVTVGALTGTSLGSITLNLGDGDDSVAGAAADVPLTVFGNVGDDDIETGSAIDTIHGGDGNDHIQGGADADVITGDAGDDLIEGDAGNDVIEGNAGDDTLIGGANDDRMDGGAGSDTYILPDGIDRIRDVEGEFDLLVFATATTAVQVDLAIRENTVQVVDSLGNAIAISGRLIAVIGSDFNDTLFGDSAANWIDGGEGNDTIDARGGDDSVFGSEGDDVLIGGEGDDTLAGGEGDDELRGDGGADDLAGEDGVDELVGGTGGDTLNGGVGNDSVRGEDGDDAIDTGDGDDTIDAGNGDDVVDAGTGNDIVNGGFGNDLLIGWADDDRIDGGEGDDRIFGDDGDDVLFGRAGNDDLDGGAGDDSLIPGAGVNQVRGGHGANQTFGEGNPPVAVADVFTVARNATNVTLNVLANDSYAPDFEEVLRIVSVGVGSAGGLVTISGGGLLLTYSPAANFSGTETFSYVLTDGTTSPTATALVTITVAP